MTSQAAHTLTLPPGTAGLGMAEGEGDTLGEGDADGLNNGLLHEEDEELQDIRLAVKSSPRGSEER